MNSLGGTWIKTSYNGSIRGKFAGPGDLYDEASDTFITPIDPNAPKTQTILGDLK